jgi:hypothetical protein
MTSLLVRTGLHQFEFVLIDVSLHAASMLFVGDLVCDQELWVIRLQTGLHRTVIDVVSVKALGISSSSITRAVGGVREGRRAEVIIGASTRLSLTLSVIFDIITAREGSHSGREEFKLKRGGDYKDDEVQLLHVVRKKRHG